MGQNTKHKSRTRKLEYGIELIQNSKFKIPYSTQRGALLMELLIVISLLAIILGVGTQAVYVSLQSGKIAGERDTAIGLASETLEMTRAVVEENWQNIHTLKGGSEFQIVMSDNRLAVSTTTETIALNNAIYTRYFVVENVSRDPSTRMIEINYNAANDDPSTLKVTVTVKRTGAETVTISEYFVRWRNKTCAQTWNTGGPGNATTTCSTTSNDTMDSTMSTTTGLQLI